MLWNVQVETQHRKLGTLIKLKYLPLDRQVTCSTVSGIRFPHPCKSFSLAILLQAVKVTNVPPDLGSDYNFNNSIKNKPFPIAKKYIWAQTVPVFPDISSTFLTFLLKHYRYKPSFISVLYRVYDTHQTLQKSVALKLISLDKQQTNWTTYNNRNPTLM